MNDIRPLKGKTEILIGTHRRLLSVPWLYSMALVFLLVCAEMTWYRANKDALSGTEPQEPENSSCFFPSLQKDELFDKVV